MPATEFGTLPDGRAVRRLVLGAAPGPVLHLLDLGATAHRLEVTAPDGVRRNVLLGLPTPAAYLASTDYLGGTIGRYANRIAGGRFDARRRAGPGGAPTSAATTCTVGRTASTGGSGRSSRWRSRRRPWSWSARTATRGSPAR